ncbi:MAG: YkgJ family cysteine cluster protein [Chloroflexi bacterium]|nr:YkgJ family cysteine cluster protein [Chloroflexota bacterium]
MNANPCLECGACCAYYRASLYWAEADDATPGGVPVELTEPVGGLYRVMKGTDQRNPRCVALQGTIGKSAFCSIYSHRSCACREYLPSWSDGKSHKRCDEARARWGLPPLRPDAWTIPSEPPPAPALTASHR